MAGPVLAFVLMLAMVACDGASPAAPTATPTATPTPVGSAVPQPSPPPGPGFDPATTRVELEKVASGFSRPLYLTAPPDGSGRLFVVEQTGKVRVIQDGVILAAPFADLASVVTSEGSEQGLLGLAFHPKYAENGRFFVAYTAANGGDNTLAEYRVSADPNRADANSRKVLLAIPDFAANHNGGMVAFGPDGYLYLSTGDGGQAGDPRGNGQNRDALLGKILRLDVDGAAPYAIPAGNPFALGGGRPEIWAYGLRNAWRFSFDRQTGDLWIADVGQNVYEEVDFEPAGGKGGVNYGWSVMEGAHCYRPSSNCDQTGLALPVAEYRHNEGCSVTGGYVYRGAKEPKLAGAYFFTDYCGGVIWALTRAADGSWTRTPVLSSRLSISSFGEDQAGEVYVVSQEDGTIYRLKAR
ncbi:MAG: glucose dehydrogenase [Anaerolinea sp.]|nr:glucose dehydrogenase [Anaerolinea sp.]